MFVNKRRKREFNLEILALASGKFLIEVLFSVFVFLLTILNVQHSFVFEEFLKPHLEVITIYKNISSIDIRYQGEVANTLVTGCSF